MEEQATYNGLSPKRIGLITASKAYDVMAKGKGDHLFGQMAQTYADELAMDRIGVKQDNFTTWQMEWGIEHEPDARKIYKDSRDVEVALPGFIIHPNYDFIGCTPDGYVVSETDEGLLEIKCPQAKAHFDYLRNGIPPKYMAQVQFQMMVCELDWCDFMTFNPKFPDELKAKVYRIEADKEYQADLLDRCIELNKLVEQIMEGVKS